MELLALNKEFQPLVYVPYINLQWEREYYTFGQFSVQILAADYDPAMAYLYTPDRPETGIIQKIELEETIKGRFVQLSGFFLEKILDDKIVYPTFYASGMMETTVRSMVQAYKGDIPLLSLGAAAGLGNSVIWQETGGHLGTVGYEKLQTQELSQRCLYDYQQNKITYAVWQGLDRTQAQTVNNFVVFSDGFRNLSKVQASLDSSNYKNYAVVAGEGEGTARKVAYADLSSGGYRQMLFVDAKNERYDAAEQTEEEYLAGLRQKGLEKLLDYQVVQNIEVDVSQGTFQYLRDFDLGDRVDVVISDIGVSLEARIVSVHEVIKRGQHTVSIELGNKKLTAYKKARIA